jgi:hypothetical protein
MLNLPNNTWFISGTHYSHTNICKGVSRWSDTSVCRPFDTLDQKYNIMYHLIEVFGIIVLVLLIQQKINFAVVYLKRDQKYSSKSTDDFLFILFSFFLSVYVFCLFSILIK